MSRTFHPWYGRRPGDSRTTLTRPSITIAERRARKARRQLQRLFPHLAHRLHKGVTAASIYQHAISLSKSQKPLP
ncbi:MAG: hypothetical protein JST39_21640 [Bacteroidetes bacterium]|nr:hypothetical protein [Bacteroidota bacterium]